MSEKEHSTKSSKLGTSKIAILSMLLGVLGLSIVILRVAVYRPWWSEFVARNVAGLLGIVGLILGFVALRRISKRIAATTTLIILCFILLQLCPFVIIFLTRSPVHPFLQQCILLLSVVCLVGLLAIPATSKWRSSLEGKFRGDMLAPFGTVLGLLLVSVWWIETCGPVSLALNQACGINLHQLGKAMLIYSNDNQGHYPEPNQWCDILLKHNEVDLKHLYCPGITFRWKRQILPLPVPKNERCYYAMNPDCEPNSPKDMVLLFETKGGWNQTGGPELLTTENHTGRCNVLFNDGHAEFVVAEELKYLRWEDEKEPVE